MPQLTMHSPVMGAAVNPEAFTQIRAMPPRRITAPEELKAATELTVQSCCIANPNGGKLSALGASRRRFERSHRNSIHRGMRSTPSLFARGAATTPLPPPLASCPLMADATAKNRRLALRSSSARNRSGPGEAPASSTRQARGAGAVRVDDIPTMAVEQCKCLPMPPRQASRRTGDHHHMPVPPTAPPTERRAPAQNPRFSSCRCLVSMRHGLSPGGNRIRTVGTAEDAGVLAGICVWIAPTFPPREIRKRR
jgi:hypothetical protein